MRVTNEELHSVRDAMRHLNQLIEKLDRREVDQIVLMRKNRMVAVIRRVEDEASGGVWFRCDQGHLFALEREPDLFPRCPNTECRSHRICWAEAPGAVIE